MVGEPMYKNNLPPANLLRHLFLYDPVTGHLYWRNPTHPRCTKGPVGVAAQRYLRVCVKGQAYAVHRIIWAIQTGGVPDTMEVDHINHIGTDNRWVNLQLLTPSENNRKKPARYKTSKPRKLKLKRYPSGRFAVLVWDVDARKYKTYGSYETEEDARKVMRGV